VTKPPFYDVDAPPRSKNNRVPSPEGTSVIPNAMPGSTSANSTDSLASFKDLAALLELINTFNALYEMNILNASKNTSYAFLNASSITYKTRIQAQIDTGTIIDKFSVIKDLRNDYEEALRALRQDSKDFKQKDRKDALKKASALISPGADITIHDLEITIERAKDEKERIDKLRSTSPSMKKRSSNLDMIIQELQDIVGKLNRSEMKLEDLPFSKEELERFLTEVGSQTSDIHPLRPLKPTSRKSSRKGSRKSSRDEDDEEEKGGDMKFPGLPNFNNSKMLKELSKAAKDLTWDIRVGYDPKVTLQRRTMDRVKKISREIDSGTLTKSEQKAKMLELQVLRQQCETDNRRSIASSKGLIVANNADSENFEVISSEGYSGPPMDQYYSKRFPEDQPIVHRVQQASTSNDWRVRPGYEPTDDVIAQRAKAASFDPDCVGGPDYFKQAQFLCNQIRDAGLGEPSEFGCINPTTIVKQKSAE
jgi:hypothetical protein